MTPEQEAAIQSHVHSIAEILYKATPAQQLETLEGIEATIRKHLLEQVGPELTLFLSETALAQRKDGNGD
ncbi:MAG: hypothetical protein HC862_24840 [Scytonema sp. RU_4_4]|nr:hypothetical protein [Scytonema sp. RU_4_4]